MFPVTDRTRVRRRSERARYEVGTVNAILDAGFVCHVGFVIDGRPVVLPTAYARVDDAIYLHGAVGNAMLRAGLDTGEVCVTVTLVDGLVFARSAFHHSMNYRSVVVFGRPEKVDDDAAKLAALDAIVDHMAAGRAADTRPPTPSELRETLVVRVPLDEVSAKVRTGMPVDDDADMELPYWAGVLPLRVQPSVAETDPHSVRSEPPDYVAGWVRASP